MLWVTSFLVLIENVLDFTTDSRRWFVQLILMEIFTNFICHVHWYATTYNISFIRIFWWTRFVIVKSFLYIFLPFQTLQKRSHRYFRFILFSISLLCFCLWLWLLYINILIILVFLMLSLLENLLFCQNLIFRYIYWSKTFWISSFILLLSYKMSPFFIISINYILDFKTYSRI